MKSVAVNPIPDESWDQEPEELTEPQLYGAFRHTSTKSPVDTSHVFTLVPGRKCDKVVAEESNVIMAACETLMRGLAYALAVLTFPFSMFACLKVVAQYERAVIFRLGRLISSQPKGPGLVFVLPCLDSVKLVDLRTFTFNVPTQEVLTKDSVTVAVDAVVYYRIFEPIMSVVNVEDANRSTRLLAQTTLRNVLGTVDLYQLLCGREQIAHNMQDCLDSATEIWGVKVERVDIKDVRLPIQLQRAMAAEAEAAREAKAKVIAAEGEQKASVALKAAAVQIGGCPIALQLRYLQTLSSISDEKNSTIIFPIPMDLIRLFKQKRSKKLKEPDSVKPDLQDDPFSCIETSSKADSASDEAADTLIKYI